MISKLFQTIKNWFCKTNSVHQYPCGCFQDIPDDRDYYKEIEQGVEPKYVNLLDGNNFKVTQQYNTNACTGHAMAAFLTILYSKIYKDEPIIFNYYYIYYWSRILAFNNKNAYKQDTGSYLRSTMQAVQKFGALSKDMCSMNSVYSRPKQLELDTSHLLAIKNYFRIPQDTTLDPLTGTYTNPDCAYNAIIYTLVKERLPILAALYYAPNTWNTARKTGILDVPKFNENSQGGHAVCIYGYDPSDDTFLVTNSWGSTWGNNGFFKITKAALISFLMDAWTVEFNYF
jgi:hypothetical protein